ncbi:MAG: GNAT family N-acetyltransferase [Thermoguttaceae bacterium]
MLFGQCARLRIMDSSDGEYVRTVRNSPEVSRWLLERCFFISDIQQREFVERTAKDSRQLFFIAEDIQCRKPFGVYSLKDIDHRNQHAELGMFLEPKSDSSGVAAFEAAVLVLDYGFNYLNLHKIVGEVLEENQRAIRLDEGLGMHVEGVRRKHVFYGGSFHDLVLYALFRADFVERPSDGVKLVRAGIAAAMEQAAAAPSASPRPHAARQ